MRMNQQCYLFVSIMLLCGGRQVTCERARGRLIKPSWALFLFLLLLFLKSDTFHLHPPLPIDHRVSRARR